MRLRASSTGMRRIYQISGAVILPVAGFLLFHASKLVYMTPIGPGPGFFPVWLCGLLVFLSLVMIFQASFGDTPTKPANFKADPGGYTHVAVSVAAIVAVALTIEFAGFPIAMLVFYACLLAIFGRRNPVEIAAISIGGSFGVDYVFSRFLSQPLPVGQILGW